jgi:hypothetical protein
MVSAPTSYPRGGSMDAMEAVELYMYTKAKIPEGGDQILQ